jgi:hypothetical protein
MLAVVSAAVQARTWAAIVAATTPPLLAGLKTVLVSVAPRPDWPTIASLAAALGTALVAGFTGWLAYETRQSIKLTQTAIDAEDRRHMDSFMPHLRLDVRESKGQVSYVSLHVRNIGPGFAQNITVVLDHGDFPLVRSVSLETQPTALGAGEEQRLALKDSIVQEKIPGFTLTYADAFGRKFQSRIGRGVESGSPYDWEPLP